MWDEARCPADGERGDAPRQHIDALSRLCDGVGVRVVHPSNPRAPAQAMGLVMFYLPPHVKMEPRGHLPEECYVILRGRGVMTLNGEEHEVSAGAFVHLPPWCEHGIKNTGDETLEVLICTAPPNR